MTVLGVPFLTGEADLMRCLDSIDIEVRLCTIDNTERNLGVAASWNHIVKLYPTEPFWLIANHDTVFAPGDLQRLVDEMQKPGPRWVGMNGDWRVFGINAECIQAVGWFDENFVPIYCEDADYERRCAIAAIPWYFIHGTTTHVGSASIKEPRYAAGNARTYPLNRAYYRAKWGGEPRGGETFTTPFNRGGHVREWTLDIDRLRSQQW